MSVLLPNSFKMFTLSESAVIACPPWTLLATYEDIHPVVEKVYNSVVTDDLVYECLYRGRHGYSDLSFSEALHYSDEYLRLLNSDFFPHQHISACLVGTVIRSEKFSRRGRTLMRRLYSYHDKTKFAFEFIKNY